MTKQELVKSLMDIDSEYLYQDIGFGGFKNKDTFMVQGKTIPVSKITKEELQEMYDREVAPLIADFLRYEQ